MPFQSEYTSRRLSLYGKLKLFRILDTVKLELFRILDTVKLELFRILDTFKLKPNQHSQRAIH